MGGCINLLHNITLNSSREESISSGKPAPFPFSSSNFYKQPKEKKKNSTARSTEKFLEKKSKNEYKQTTLFGTRMFDESHENKNLTRMMENSDFVDEQKRIFENIKNNKQRTLRSYTSKQKTPTNSYKDLFSNTSGYVVCCKENGELRLLLEEICNILGLCYLSELDEGVTHLIYEGNENQILEFAKELDVCVINKDWLLDCIAKREPLHPSLYKRQIT